MKLTQVDIIDFKSIKKETLKIRSNQLCVVGKNESGKSSLINAISYLNIYDNNLNNKLLNKSSSNYPHGLPVIIGLFEINYEIYIKFTKLLAENIDAEYIAHLPKRANKSFIQLKRWGNGFTNLSLGLSVEGKLSLNISEHIRDKAKFYDIFFNEYFPTINYYEKEELLIEPASVDDFLGNDKRFETFRRLLFLGGCTDFNLLNSGDIDFISAHLSDITHELNKILKKHYKQDDSINISFFQVQNKYNLIIRDSTNKSFAISERSPGFQYYFSFLINKLYFNKVNTNKNNIIILDEPGNGLHPKGAKDLLKTFDEISENSQIIYTTHNPFLTVRNCIDSLVFVYKSADEGTKINQKPFLNKYQVLRKELGILLNDSFLIGDLNLIVEGNTEKLAFHRLFQHDKYQDLQWLNIYNADGVENIPQAINYLGKNNLKLSGIVFFDSDEEARKAKDKKTYKSNMVESNWFELEVNIAYKDKVDRTFEDLFPQSLFIEAFNTYCSELKAHETFEKEYVNIEFDKAIDLPIIDTLSKHYKSFLPEGSKSNITKQDVMRILLDNIEKFPETEQRAHLKNVYGVCDKILETFNKLNKDAKH